MNKKELAAYVLGVRLGQTIRFHSQPRFPFGSDAEISLRCLSQISASFERFFGSNTASFSGITKRVHDLMASAVEFGTAPERYGMHPNVDAELVGRLRELHPIVNVVIGAHQRQCVSYFQLGWIVGNALRESGDSTAVQCFNSDLVCESKWNELLRLLTLCDVSPDALLPEETEREAAPKIEYPQDLSIWRRVELGIVRLEQQFSRVNQDDDSGVPSDVKRTTGLSFDGPYGLRFENYRITRKNVEGSGELCKNEDIAFLYALFQAGDSICGFEAIREAVAQPRDDVEASETLPRDRIYSIKSRVNLQLKRLGVRATSIRARGYKIERIAPIAR